MGPYVCQHKCPKWTGYKSVGKRPLAKFGLGLEIICEDVWSPYRNLVSYASHSFALSGCGLWKLLHIFPRSRDMVLNGLVP